MCPGVCFVSGTLVALADGSAVPIEDLRRDQEVVGVHPPSEAGPATRAPARVEGLHRREVDQVLELRGPGFRIRCTAEHPFWIEGRGWTTAGALRPGDRLLAADGEPAPLEEIRTVEQTVTVHNLTVGNTHTYLVGARGLLVHNKPMCP